MCYIVNSVLNHNPYFIHFPDSTSCFKYKLYVQYQWFTSLHCVNLNRQNLIWVVGVRSALAINHLPSLRICCHTSMKFNRFSNKKNQRLSRACIVHLVIKKTNWSYVKTMSCSGSHLGITINIKNTKFVKDLPMIDAQFRFNQCNSFREEYISVFSPYGSVLIL